MNGKGKIFMDRPDINLNNYPHLIQLMSGDSQGNYTPFDYPKDIVEHKTFTKEENIETMARHGMLLLRLSISDIQPKSVHQHTH